MTIEIGQKIERWTVLEKLSKNGRVYYRCQCECGTFKDVNYCLFALTKSLLYDMIFL
jgi:hypothetical protein